MNKPVPDTETARRRVSQGMREWLDDHARQKGYARFVEMPGDVLDVNEADRAIGGTLHDYILHPLAYVKNFMAKRPDTESAREMGAAMAAGREARRKMERQLRRHLQTMLAVWEDEWMPALLEAQAIARQEHREDESIGSTLDRLAADGRLRVPSSFYIYELGRAIAHKDFSAPPAASTTPDTTLPATPWPVTALKDGHAELRPLAAAKDGDWLVWQPHALADALEKMNLRLQSLGERTRDIYYIMMAKWVQHKSSGKEGNPWIAVDEILEMLGYTKKMDDGARRYGFADRDRWDVRQAIESLATVWVNMKLKMTRNRKQVQVPYRGHFLMLGDRRGQPELGTEVRRTAVDAFTHIEFDIPALAQQGVDEQTLPYLRIHIQALQYTGKQALEKGIAYYLAEMARINVSDTVRTKPATLLEQAGKVELDPRKPGATRTRLHTALNTLADDGVAAEWKYADPGREQALRKAQAAGKRPRGWANEWLQAPLDIMLPQEFSYPSILAHRQERRQARLQRKASTTPAPPAEAFTLGDTDATTLAAQLATAIQQQELNKADAATAIGISRPTLNALLTGKPTRAAVQQRASAWLHTAKENAE